MVGQMKKVEKRYPPNDPPPKKNILFVGILNLRNHILNNHHIYANVIFVH